MWDITKLALSATSFPFTRADSKHEARSFTSCSTRQRNALPLSPALFESRRSIPAQGTCALRYLRDTSISGPRLGRVLSLTWPRASPGTHEITGRPFLFPTRGSSVSARPRPAPHPRGHRLRRPGGDKEPDPARGRLCRHWITDAFLSPRTPHHAPTPSSQKPTAHSWGSFTSSRCFVSDVKSQPLELTGPDPAQKASPMPSFPALASLEVCLRRGGT